MRSVLILLAIFILCSYGCLADNTLQVTVYPNPFEQGSATTFTIYMPQNDTVRRLTIDFYSQGNYLFQVSPPISSPTTQYMWNGCYPNSTQCLSPGTYSYVVKAGCGCGGNSRVYEATGTVTINPPGGGGGGTQPPTGCYSSETECKNNNVSKCSCAEAVICNYDSSSKCFKFNSCDNSKCGAGPQPSTEKMQMQTFIQRVASSGAINYAAIGVCPSEGPTAFPQEGKLGYWCKVTNVGSPGQEGAIRYWALLKNDPNNNYDDESIEIYIFYARPQCQNPPQARAVGCTECVLFLYNMLNTQEIPKIAGESAISTLRIYQGAAPIPSPSPGTQPGPQPSPSQPPMPQGIQVSASPNPFVSGASTTINVTTSQSYRTLYVTIYSNEKQVLSATVDAGTHTTSHAYTWNGRDSSGNLLPPGRYKCVIKACSSGCTAEATYYLEIVGQSGPQPSASPVTGGGLQVDVNPNPFAQGSTTTFKVSATDGSTISEISVKIFDLTGTELVNKRISGNTFTWDGKSDNGTALRIGAYIFVIYAKANGQQKGPAKGYVYIEQAGAVPTPTGPQPTISQTGPQPSLPGPQQSPSVPPITPGSQCLTNADCFCGDGCYKGNCLHPELTINGSANSLLAFTGTPLETTIVWTLTNAGDDSAVLREIKPTGCENLTCSLEVQAGATVKLAPYESKKVTKSEEAKLKTGTTKDNTSVIKFQESFKFEYGEVDVGLEWKPIKLNKSFSSPIVVAKPIESCSGNGETQCDKVVVRIKNIQSNSFEIRLQKWGRNSDTPLTRSYKVEYLVLEEGHYDNVNGLEIEAGKFKTNHVGALIAFKKNFSKTPVLLTSVASFNGSEAVVTRNFNPCKDGTYYYPLHWVVSCGEVDFITKIQEIKDRFLKYGHEVEDIHYIAITPGKATIDDTLWEVRWIHNVNDEGATVFFETDFPDVPVVIADAQTVNEDESMMLRFYKKERDSIHFFIAEEDSTPIICLGCHWWAHKPEEVGYVAIAKSGAPTGLKAVIETDKDGCTCPPCTINFDGSKSTGNIVSYEWDFGDNSTGTGAKVSHTYNKEGTFVVKLTVKDDKGNTASATKTIVVNACVQPINGTVIEPGKSIKIIQKISGLKPGKYDFDLHVKYTDLFGASNKEVSEWKKVTVEVAKLGSEKFHIKLLGEEQNFCIGPNGIFGITGKAATPKIKFSWAFVGDNAIKIDECDEKGSAEFIYCDPVQFSIELAQKLNKISELAKSNRFGEIKTLTSFKAHLIGDSYSETFQKDFAKAYAQGFLAAPTWFTSGSTPWQKYFEDPTALTFEPREIESGLYNVVIDMNFKGEEWQFFKEGKPNAIIKVRFEKLNDASVDVQDLPFYYMPFNGLVGSSGRSDYGLGFTNTKEPIIITTIGSEKIDTSITGGKKNFTTTLYKELSELLEAQSKVMRIDLGGKKIEFYTSQPMPAILGIKSTNGKAEGFYQIYSQDKALGAGFDGVAYWTGIATSPDLNCGDFYGYEMPFKKKDSPASSLGINCAEKNSNMPAFGFQWTNVANNQSIFLATVFYTPPGQRMSIANACTSDICLLASNSGISKSVEQPLSLDSDLKTEKIKDIVSLIEQEYICVVPEQAGVHASQNSYLFFWNEQKLSELLETAKQRIASEWKFNWANYECK